MKRKKFEEMARKRQVAANSKPIINLTYQKGDIWLMAAISENTEKGMAALWTRGVLPVTPHDLRQIGWMLMDFAGRVEDEAANEGESADYSTAFLEGYRHGFTYNIVVNPYPKDTVAYGEYHRGYEKGESERQPLTADDEQEKPTQCEHVDPTYGRCQKDWGHDSGGGHLYHEPVSARFRQ